MDRQIGSSAIEVAVATGGTAIFVVPVLDMTGSNAVDLGTDEA